MIRPKKMRNSTVRIVKELLEEIENLQEEKKNLEQMLSFNAGQVNQLRHELSEVYGSKKWMLVQYLARIVVKWLPLGSRRRNFLKRIYYLFKRSKAGIALQPTIAPLNEVYSSRFEPKISVIVPVFNVKEKYLRDCIESVRAQTYTNWELCIVDDASTMHNIRPLLEYYAKIDKRIKVQFSIKNGHIAVASNLAIAMSTGDYVGFLDNDDILCPNALDVCVDFLRLDKSLDIIYTDNYNIDPHNNIIGKMIKPDWSPEFFLSTNYLVHFCLYSRRIIKQVNGLNEDERFRGTQDTELKARMLPLTNNIGHVPLCLYQWRIHPGSVSVDITEKKYMLDNSLATFQYILEHYYQCYQGKVVMPVEAKNAGNGYYTVVFPPKLCKIAVVIPVLLHEQYNEGLLDILRDFAQKAPIHIIVSCRQLFSNEETDGYTVVSQERSAVTKAVRDCGAEQVLLLSNDIENLSLESIISLAGYVNLSNEIGTCGGKVLSADGKILRGAYLLMNHLQIMHSGLGSSVTYQQLCAQNCSAVTGSFMIIRSEVFFRFNGFDFLNFGVLADVDFCLRLRQAGLRVVYNPRAIAQTVLPNESDMTKIYSSNAYKRLHSKYYKFWGNDPYYSSAYSQDFQYQVIK